MVCRSCQTLGLLPHLESRYVQRCSSRSTDCGKRSNDSRMVPARGLIRFAHGARWISFCGTIPAFAFVIVHETVVRNGPGLATPEQRRLFQSVEDGLYALYKANQAECYVPLDKCLLLDSELWAVCKAFDCLPDVHMSPDAILGIILPKRLSNYQKDWSSALFRLAQGHRDINFSDYAAMRLAADLTGIATPPSLVGHTAADFRIEKYGSASIVLTQFATACMNAFP